MKDMECDHCHYKADYWDRMGGILKASKLPDGDVKYTCQKCVNKIVIDFYIKSNEFQYFNGNRDLIAR